MNSQTGTTKNKINAQTRARGVARQIKLIQPPEFGEVKNNMKCHNKVLNHNNTEFHLLSTLKVCPQCAVGGR